MLMITRKLTSLALAGAALVSLLGMPAHAQTVYKSVDKQGNVSFTDRPPLQQQAGDQPLDVMEVQIRLTDPAAIAANRDESAAQSRAEDVAAGIREQQAGEDAAEMARVAQQRAANCELAKSRLTRYSEARRLYRAGEDGERSYLSGAEIDAERVEAARAVDEWCGS